jgi:protein tyrosine phosphatase
MSPIPNWLISSYTSEHLESVAKTLGKRESERNSARSTSRRKSEPKNKVSQLSSALHTKNPHHEYYSVSVGCQPENVVANRYYMLEPYDRTRVVIRSNLSDVPETKGRYINANWVCENFGRRWWIATQAPLPHTSHAFLSVIMQPTSYPPPDLSGIDPSSWKATRVQTVVQLTPNFEEGIQKAHVYFPPIVGESWIVQPQDGCEAPPIKATLIDQEEIEDSKCTMSTVSLSHVLSNTSTRQGHETETVTFKHMMYHAWPDHSVPADDDRPSLLNFARLVDRVNKTSDTRSGDASLDPPIMVGCSAGVGRTGAFIALCSLLRAYGLLRTDKSAPENHSLTSPSLTPNPVLKTSPLGPLSDELQEDLVAQEIDSLREQRPSMVQKVQQILFVYEMLAKALQEQD